jgi:tetratricopeptide (TPR) repeat protein
LALLCSTPPATAAAELLVKARISSPRVYLGDPVQFELRVQQDSDKLPEIDAAKLEELSFKPVGPPARGSSVQIVNNGVQSETYSFLFRYQAVPQQPGRFTVPSLTVRQGKETARTEPIEVEVIGPEQQDRGIVEITPSEPTVYPGQAITLSLDVLIRRLEHDGEVLEHDPFDGNSPPHLKVPWLEGSELLRASAGLDDALKQRAQENGPSFLVNDLFRRQRGFFLLDQRVEQVAVRFDRDAVQRTGLDGEQHAYYRYRLPLEYRAARSGEAGPLTASLRGTVYVGVQRGPRGLVPAERQLFAVAPPRTITVANIPVAGRPETFTGGIGIFTIQTNAEPKRVHVGDPITLTVRVGGTGTLEDVGPPILAVQPKWSADFKVHEPAAARIERGTRTFTFTVRPKHDGVKELPAIRLGFFNPKSKKFEEALSSRLPVEVLEAARLDPDEIVDKRPAERSQSELEELAAGLAANYTGPDVLDPHGPYRAALAVWTALTLAPPLAWLATFFVHRRVLQRRQNPARLRAQAAYRRALERLDAASRQELTLPEAVARAVACYLADRLNLPAGELTPADARYHAMSLGAAHELAQRFADLLEECDRARFAPAAAEVIATGAERRSLASSDGNGDAAAAPSQAEPRTQRGTSGVSGSDLPGAARALINELERLAPANSQRIRRPVSSPARVDKFGAAVLLAALITRSPVAQPTMDRHALLARGNAAFERGARAADVQTARQAFEEAIAAYRELLRDGVENGKLYYNLANAYFRIADVPRAILYYRLAQRLLPRDDQVAANLAFARSRVTDSIEATPTSRLLRQLFFAHYAWSVRERTAAAAACYAIAWLLLSARLWLPHRTLTIAGVAGLAASAALAYSAFAQTHDDHQRPIGVLAGAEVVVRKGDGETYEPQFNRPLGPGIELRLLESRDHWLRIELPDGKTGWVTASEVVVEQRVDAT